MNDTTPSIPAPTKNKVIKFNVRSIYIIMLQTLAIQRKMIMKIPMPAKAKMSKQFGSTNKRMHQI